MTAGDIGHRAAGEAERRRLVGHAGVVGAGTLVSRVLGLLRDVVLAAVFTREETDAFFVAFRIPNSLRQLLAEGAISSAVVPMLSEKLATEGDEAARAFFARVRGVSLVVLCTVTALGMLFAEPLCELFAAGHHARAGEFERTVGLTRAVFPYILCMGTAALGMAALNAKRRFAVAAFAPGLLNVAFLATALGLPALFAAQGLDRAYALVVGALLGGVLQVVAQWPSLRALGFLSTPRFAWSDPGVREVFRRVVPMTLGLGIYQVDIVLSTRFLSELGPGAQSYFTWASRVCDFPQGIFVMALSTAALPSLATLAAKGAHAELGKTYAHGLKLALFVALPASIATAVLAEPLVVAMFQRGAFDAESARQTARALFWQGSGIWTVAAVRQLVPVFHAMGDTRTPVYVSAIDLLAFIALAVALKGPMGHAGISVAVTASSFVQMVLLFAGLKGRLGSLHARNVGDSALRTLAASLVAALTAWAVAHLAVPEGAAGGLARTLPGVLGGSAFALSFVAMAWGLGSQELDALFVSVRRRAPRPA